MWNGNVNGLRPCSKCLSVLPPQPRSRRFTKLVSPHRLIPGNLSPSKAWMFVTDVMTFPLINYQMKLNPFTGAKPRGYGLLIRLLLGWTSVICSWTLQRISGINGD